MKKLFSILILFVAIQTQIMSQNANTTISGSIIENSTSEPVEYASIRIMNAKDSAFVTGGTSNEKGKFSIAVKPANYIALISYLGYRDHYVNVDARRNASIGNITLKEDDVYLSEAIVEAKAIEIQVKGDTIEYNADSYKVQESAVVQDLLKKMPGVEIDSEGKITVNGKEVKKFLVDGKEFFSDDPKVASKNLPAKMVDKLQVLDQRSDMSLMTGFDDGSEETVINLTVKKGMKEGMFGNALAGYGSEDRYEGSGMVNYMRNETQISVLGGVNNTNNAGSSDLSSAMFGSSSGGGRPRGLRFGGNNGVTKSITGGFNFATEHSDKLKWGGDVRYGNNDNNVSSQSITQYTTNKNPRNEFGNSWGNNKGQSFATNLKFEWTPDSLTTVIFRPRVEYNTNDKFEGSNGETQFTDDPTKDYSTITEYLSTGTGYKLNGNLDISRKLNNKGRVISLGLSGGVNNSESDGFDFSKIAYQTRDSIIDQRFFQDDDSHNWRVFMSYVEPIGRSNFLQLSYNIRSNNSKTDKRSYYNNNMPGFTPDYSNIDTLYTRYVKNEFINQNVSLSFRAVREKYNYTVGLGLEPSTTLTSLSEPSSATIVLPRKNYLNFAPNAQFNYLWDRRSNLRIDYSGTTNQASTLQLYDGVYSRSGMNTTSGNPDLRPSFQNRFNIRFRKFNPEQASFLMLFGRFTQTSNDIVTTSVYNDDGGRDMTYRNVSGNMNGNLRFIINRPLRNRDWSINSMTYSAYTLENTFIDEQKNKAKTLNLQENVGIQFRKDITKSLFLKSVDFALRGNIQYRDINNSISKNNNQHTFNYGGVFDFTLYFPYDFALESDVNYSTNSGYSAGYKQDEWLWNASISKQVFKNKSGTIRLKMYDILKERSNISRNTYADRIEDVTTNTISSYLMVHFVYRFQIFKGGVKAADMGGQGMGRGPGGRPH